MADADVFELFSSVRYDPALQAVSSNADFNYAGWNYTNSSPFYMLNFHRDRLLRAAKHWGWDDAISAIADEAGFRTLEQALLDAVEGHPANEPLRCRVCLGKSGTLSCDVFTATPASLVGLLPPQLPPPGFMISTGDTKDMGSLGTSLMRSLHDELASEPYKITVDSDCTPSSAYTHYKTTQRQVYDDARRRAGILGPEHREVLLINSEKGVVMDGSISTAYFWRDGRWVTPPVPPQYKANTGSGGLDGTTRRWAIERGLATEEEVTADSLVNGEECWLSNGVRGYLYGKVSLPPRIME